MRLHDLRRTGATGIAALGIAPQIVSKVLAHKGGGGGARWSARLCGVLGIGCPAENPATAEPVALGMLAALIIARLVPDTRKVNHVADDSCR